MLLATTMEDPPAPIPPDGADEGRLQLSGGDCRL